MCKMCDAENQVPPEFENPQEKSGSEFSDLLSDYPLRARFKNRIPNPGICTVTEINWQDKGLSMVGGDCIYYPAFSEVELLSKKEAEELTGR